MTTTLAKVVKIVSPIIDALAKSKSVLGILCFGSYAAGTQDQYSDIDLYVVCEPEILAVAERQTLFNNVLGITALKLDHSVAGWENQWNPQSDNLTLNQIPLELTYNTKEWLATVVHKVTKEGAISIPELTFRPYTMLGLLAGALILYDPRGWIEALRTQLDPYPEQLKQRLVKESTSLMRENLADLCDCARRGFGHTAFLFYLWRTCDALRTLLFAINEKYDSATKRSEHELSKLALLPNQFMARYEKLLEGPFTPTGQQTIAVELSSLAEETVQLIPV